MFAPSIALIAQGLSAVSFGAYGISCFFSRRMQTEFERYRVPRLLRLTGALQVAGALGIVAGHWYRPVLILSASGLMLMMMYAVYIRFRIRDPLYAALPAFSYVLLNAYIVYAALKS